jgi:hypothetical protein
MRIPLIVALAIVGLPGGAWACSVRQVMGAEELVRTADVIVRARASDYAQAPRDADRYGPPSGRVRFAVLERVSGAEVPATLQLPGVLMTEDDFNDRQPPYAFVRPGGRHGNCYAFEYKRGAEFLLFLKKHADGYTVDWAPLAAVNEQLRSADDPWLAWVRRSAKPAAKKD